MHTFTYQKNITSYTFLLVFKIVKSLQYILKHRKLDKHKLVSKSCSVQWCVWGEMVHKGVRSLLMVLVGHRSNVNRQRAWKKMEWIVCHSDST